MKSHSLLVRIDSPINKSTHISSQIVFSAWAILSGAEGEARLKAETLEVDVILEVIQARDSLAYDGLGLLGEALNADVSSEHAYLESLTIQEERRMYLAPDLNLWGWPVSISGVINAEALEPSAGGSKLLRLTLVSKSAERIGISNSVIFSLTDENQFKGPLGGFITEISPSLHSDVLLLQGWCFQRGYQVQSIDVQVNGNFVGNADFGLESETSGKLLPDIKEAAKAGFEIAIQRKALSLNSHMPTAGIQLRVNFSSGEYCELISQGFYWYPSPPVLNGVKQSFLGLESINFAPHCGLELDCALSHPYTENPEVILKTLHGEYVSGGAESPIQLEFSTGETQHSFPGYALSDQTKVLIKINPLCVNPLLGLVRLYLRFPLSGAVQEVLSEKERVWLSDMIFARQEELRRHSKRRFLFEAQQKIKSSAKPIEVVKSINAKSAPKLCLVFHHLSKTEGAPRVLFEVLRGICGTDLSPDQILCVSGRDGNLRESIEALGVAVSIIPEVNVIEQTWERYGQGSNKFETVLKEFDANFILGNGLDSFFAIDAAERLGIESLWVIHESIYPQRWYRHLDERIRYRFLRALQASRVAFVSEYTRALYAAWIDEAASLVIRNGVDVEMIENQMQSLSLEEARSRLGLPRTATVISIVGTTTYRKGQDIFLTEMASLRSLHPEREFVFQIVGARELDYLHELKEQTAALGIESQTKFISETPDVAPYFIASDVMVVSSREESSPLVSLEAFAYERPLVSSTVFGLKEQIKDGENALAFNIEERGTLAEAVSRVLTSPELAKKIVEGGRKTVRDEFSLKQMQGNYRKALWEYSDKNLNPRKVQA